MAEYRRVGSGIKSTENSRPASYNRQPERPPVPSRPSFIDERSSVPSNMELGNQSHRANKNMPLLKKFGSSKNSSSRNNSKRENGQSVTKNNRSNVTQNQELNEAKTRGPTIIRSGNSNLKKKVAPPRPPPPKTLCNGPPSYEEVLQSDFNSYMGELSGNRRRPAPAIPLAPRPPVPNHRRLPPPLTARASTQKTAANALIDFDSPAAVQPTCQPTLTAVPKNNNLLDLDEIFSCNDFPVPSSTSLQGNSCWSNSSFEVGGGGGSRADDWLQSCLQHNSSNWDAWSNSSSPSPEPPSTSPPPVPLNSDYDAASLSSDAPPLPPRSKVLQITKPHAVALYDYTPQQADELNFKTNETIMLVHRVNKDWLYGYTDRSAGLFPNNFVNILVPLPESNSQKITCGPRCRVIYDFAAEHENDLSLRAGDVVALEAKENDSWLRGTVEGRSGLFPATFVEIIEDLPHAAAPNNVTGNEKCGVALYDFVGEEGEISFGEGQTIIVSGKVNENWSTGRVQGSNSEGRFPSAFVHMLN